jgi:hypothetical protein
MTQYWRRSVSDQSLYDTKFLLKLLTDDWMWLLTQHHCHLSLHPHHYGELPPLKWIHQNVWQIPQGWKPTTCSTSHLHHIDLLFTLCFYFW